jgi:hypothetical protein
VISYRQLLLIFWQDHDPTQRSWGRQYMSLAFYHNAEQHLAIKETMAEEETRRGKAIVTEVRPAGEFFRAEDYHQKYYLRQQRQLAEEFKIIYPQSREFTDSTATARVNGYLGGNGTTEQMTTELPQLGLSKIGQTRLKEQIGYRLN